MNSQDDARYRLTLAEGYLDKAERFYGEASWHDCVRDAQAETALTAARRAVVAAGEVYRTLFESSPASPETSTDAEYLPI